MLLKRRLLWLMFLAPFFFLSYGFANWYASQRTEVTSLVFGWESVMPLYPWTIIPYWSIDLLYGVAFLLPATKKGIDILGKRLLVVQVLCVGCFLLFPLKFSFQRPELTGFFGYLFDLLMGFDKPYNQAPSLHIALVVILWREYWQYCVRKWHWLINCWFILIGVSVLTTWQHHFFDVPTGIAAGLFVLWLIPDQPKTHWRMRYDSTALKLSFAYLFVGLGLAIIASHYLISLISILMYWLALALIMVALNYSVIGADGFQKYDKGCSLAVTWLMLPYRFCAWLNTYYWTNQQPAANEVVSGVWLGRLPTAEELTRYDVVLDVCAELSFPRGLKSLLGLPNNKMQKQGKKYLAVPMLDLCIPEKERCIAAANDLEVLSASGRLLVCCALGYSRSAIVIASWLILTGKAENAKSAVEMIKMARPQVKFNAKALALLGEIDKMKRIDQCQNNC